MVASLALLFSARVSWFRGNSIKQYTGFFIRTETTLNNPKSLGLQKPVLFLQAYLWKGIECNNRFLDCCADVEVSSLSDQGCLLFNKPVTDPAGRCITAPDFRKNRQTALAKELLKPKYQVFGFTTADLYKNLSAYFRSSCTNPLRDEQIESKGPAKKTR